MKNLINTIFVLLILSCGQNHHLSDFTNSASSFLPGVSLNNPGHIFLGKAKVLSGSCESPGLEEDVIVTISGATPSMLTCPCSNGIFTCPSTVFTSLPEVLNFDVLYKGLANTEMGFSSCAPYTPPTNGGKEYYYKRLNAGRIVNGYTHSSNFSGTDGFGLPTKSGGTQSVRNHPLSFYRVDDTNDGFNTRELTYSGVMINVPNCIDGELFETGDSLDIRYSTAGVGRYVIRFKAGNTPNGAGVVYNNRQTNFNPRYHTRNISITGEITTFYSRVYFVDDKDSAQMNLRYRVNGGSYKVIPTAWISDSHADASLSVSSFISPTAIDDKMTGNINEVLEIDVIANDIDDTGIDKSLNVILENADALTEGVCSLTASPNYLVRFTPISGFLGQASCTYKVCDDDGFCDTAKVQFNYK